jgi:hypothetical protein
MKTRPIYSVFSQHLEQYLVWKKKSLMSQSGINKWVNELSSWSSKIWCSLGQQHLSLCLDWLAYKRQKCTSDHSRDWKSEVRGLASSSSGEDLFLSAHYYHLIASSLGEGPLCKGTNLTMRVLPSWPSCFPKFPPPNTITLGLGFQHTNLGETKTFNP